MVNVDDLDLSRAVIAAAAVDAATVDVAARARVAESHFDGGCSSFGGCVGSWPKCLLLDWVV